VTVILLLLLGEMENLYASSVLPSGGSIEVSLAPCPACSTGQGVAGYYRSEKSSLHRATAVRCPANDADGPKATRLGDYGGTSSARRCHSSAPTAVQKYLDGCGRAMKR
jgi:hypothetical protein